MSTPTTRQIEQLAFELFGIGNKTAFGATAQTWDRAGRSQHEGFRAVARHVLTHFKRKGRA